MGFLFMGGDGVNHCDSSPAVVFWTCPAWKMSDVRVCDVSIPMPYLNSMWFQVYYRLTSFQTKFKKASSQNENLLIFTFHHFRQLFKQSWPAKIICI